LGSLPPPPPPVDVIVEKIEEFPLPPLIQLPVEAAPPDPTVIGKDVTVTGKPAIAGLG
jgi:hypothetical protein